MLARPQDGLRRIVVDLLQDKESLKKQEIIEAAHKQVRWDAAVRWGRNWDLG